MPVTYSTFTFPNPAGTGFGSAVVTRFMAGYGTTTPTLPPDVPTPISPGTAITFKWSASTGATKYWLQVNTSAEFTGANMFNAEVGNVTSQEVTGLSLGTSYYWRVKAGNNTGWSNWSTVRSVLVNTVP